jgi:hypothetical protein
MTILKHVLGGPQTAGDQWTSGFHTFATNLAAEAAHDLLEAAFAISLGANMLKPWIAPGTRITDLTTYVLDPLTGRALEVARSAVDVTGTSAGAQPNPRLATVIGLRTAKPGVSGRGRMYLPAPATTNFDATGLITAQAREGIGAAMSAFMAQCASRGITPGLHDKATGTIVPFRQVTVGAVAGSQRRRTNKIPNSYVSYTFG